MAVSGAFREKQISRSLPTSLCSFKDQDTEGQHNSENYKNAMETLKNAAQTKLEISRAILEMGETIQKNGLTPEMARNIENSAQDGDIAAQYVLSMLYRSGLGMEKCLISSFMWAEK